MIQIDEEGFDDLIDADLRDFLRLNFTHKVSEDPLYRLKLIFERDSIHHFDRAAFLWNLLRLVCHRALALLLRCINLLSPSIRAVRISKTFLGVDSSRC